MNVEAVNVELHMNKDHNMKILMNKHDYDHNMKILELKGQILELQDTVQKLNTQIWKLDWHVNVEAKTEIKELKMQNQKLLADRVFLGNKVMRLEAAFAKSNVAST